MSGELILVVEDEPDLAAGLRDTLELMGYHVMSAGNGQEALRGLEQIQPDLIISDIGMPVMDGYQFFNAVRSRPKWITIPFLFLTARSHKSDMLIGKGLGADDYLTKPWSTDELLIAISSKLKRAEQLALVQMQKAYKESLSVLANAIEARDAYTRGHVERVSQYALAIGRQLQLIDQALDVLEFGAILHDIGKIAVPESILAKPGPLSESERREIRQHPVTGAHMLKDMSYVAVAIPAVHHHHEHYDGSGYPDGLAGEAIPLEARIVAVADALDAITTSRPYREARPFEAATTEILRQSGKQFDPIVVSALQGLWQAGEGLLTSHE
jgi:putative two-component system response regulator